MDQNERDQKLRLKAIEPLIKALDLSKYGYAFECGPITKWFDELSGNINDYVWQNNDGSLKFTISVFAKFRQEADKLDSDYLAASISGPDESEGYLDLSDFEEDKNHPLKRLCYNHGNKPVEEFVKQYIEALMAGLDTYLNDFIMGRRFETTKFDRGDY